MYPQSDYASLPPGQLGEALLISKLAELASLRRAELASLRRAVLASLRRAELASFRTWVRPDRTEPSELLFVVLGQTLPRFAALLRQSLAYSGGGRIFNYFCKSVISLL